MFKKQSGRKCVQHRSSCNKTVIKSIVLGLMMDTTNLHVIIAVTEGVNPDITRGYGERIMSTAYILAN